MNNISVFMQKCMKNNFTVKQFRITFRVAQEDRKIPHFAFKFRKFVQVTLKLIIYTFTHSLQVTLKLTVPMHPFR